MVERKKGFERKVIIIGGMTLVIGGLVVSSLVAPKPKSPFDIMSGQLKAAIKKKDFTTAFRIAEKRAEFAQKKFPQESPQLSDAIYDHGTLFALEGQHEKALSLIERAVALDIRHRGTTDLGLGKKMVALAETKEALGDLTTAAKFATKASAILEADQSDRLLKFRAKADLIQVHAMLQTQDCAAAAELAAKGMLITNKSLRKENALMLGFATAAGNAAHCSGDIAQAEAFISDAVSIARRVKSEELPKLMSLHGDLLCQLGKCKRGAKVQEKGYKAAQKIYGEGSERAESFAPTIDRNSDPERGSLSRGLAHVAPNPGSPAADVIPEPMDNAQNSTANSVTGAEYTEPSHDGATLSALPDRKKPSQPVAREVIEHTSADGHYEAF